ncbi:MAG: YdcF family protein [Prevotellaceae bacterium]|jgi:SanA protein|nr:YdcF family protein [Prevotellaceae bacterium]
MTLKKAAKAIGIVLASLVVLLVVGVAACSWIIMYCSKGHNSDNIADVPKRKVALLLGTSQWVKGGGKNQYFTNRIEATIELYKSGKVSHIVASGDNREISYNEPQDMRKALIAGGVPDSVIYLDYAGVRTYDSIVRINKIFGQTQFIVVSQKFHNQRVVYIAQHFKLDAYGYNAKDVGQSAGFRTQIREVFARVKVFLDLTTNKQPRYLGKAIEIK